MRPAMILTALVLSVMPPEPSIAHVASLPPGINGEFLSWPARKVAPAIDADALPGDTLMYRDPLSGARVMTVTLDGILMIVDPAPDAHVIEFWVRVLPATSQCSWQRSRERAA
jgi:hypothetical protein